MEQVDVGGQIEWLTRIAPGIITDAMAPVALPGDAADKAGKFRPAFAAAQPAASTTEADLAAELTNTFTRLGGWDGGLRSTTAFYQQALVVIGTKFRELQQDKAQAMTDLLKQVPRAASAPVPSGPPIPDAAPR